MTKLVCVFSFCFIFSGCNLNPAPDAPPELEKPAPKVTTCNMEVDFEESEIVATNLAKLQICLRNKSALTNWSLITSSTSDSAGFGLYKLEPNSKDLNRATVRLCATPNPQNKSNESRISYYGSSSDLKVLENALEQCSP